MVGEQATLSSHTGVFVVWWVFFVSFFFSFKPQFKTGESLSRNNLILPTPS